jgi:hypothetical protein
VRQNCRSIRLALVTEVEGAVLADDSGDRPHPRDVIAPAGRAPGYRDDGDAGRGKRLHGSVGGGREPALIGQRVVEVGEHHLDGAALR